ncbi:general secretion pathway protein GspB [Duganella sp. HH101]|uniref:general secretion pathway protein GspB n=1 Tax=Duganella sp. HH101 TaxID=1781066 RepID=UPI00087421CD|nr:general secretion pathway protein GspB [Duganella sp. HH101]OFA03155.1 hypothetical protein DUGA2_28780 [Duganella sp. HH101]
MSYILEALKKAQAERQLGSAPTLHAPVLHGTDRKTAGGALTKPLVLAALAMGVAIVVLLVLVLRPAQQRQPADAQQVAAVAAGGPAATPVAAATPAAVPAPVAPVVPAQAGGAPLAAALPPPVATVTPAPRPQPVAEAAVAAPVSAPAPATPAPLAAADKPAKPAAAPEEPVQNLRDLPEPIQRSIPHVTVGGYIYSKNPADRLLLIDKILRHEGEEVAPGLMLEKLQPREAVFSFKGYRYRVPY